MTTSSIQLHPESVSQPIIGFHLDEERHWVAELACGHGQHVRHDPPWQSREWTQTESGRKAMLGTRLMCKRCAQEGLQAS